MNDAFAKRLLRLCVEKKFNKRALADASGLTRDEVSTYCQGVIPGPENLGKLAVALGVTEEYLLNGSLKSLN